MEITEKVRHINLFYSIRSVVNIDACGTTGREILFQANSREMIDAYKQAPYPHGTVMVMNYN